MTTMQGPPASSYTCPWCRTVSAADGNACPACGAAIDVTLKRSNSGWYEMPGAKDMAQIHFGRSRLQISGTYVPQAEFALAQGEGIYFMHHQLLWKDPALQCRTITPQTGFSRILAGMPLHMIEAAGPGRVALSRDRPGEVVAIPIQPNQAVDVKEHIFLAASSLTRYEFFQTGLWFVTGTGDERETHRPLGMFMDRFHAGGQPGLVLVHAGGNVFLRGLAPGESICIRPTSLLFKDPTVAMQLHLEYPSGFDWMPGFGTRYVWLRCTGPGRVAMQSAYDHFEDPHERITGSSYVTRRNW